MSAEFYDRTKDLDTTLTVSGKPADAKAVGDAIPTDEHINSLIDTKLGVIENGTY